MGEPQTPSVALEKPSIFTPHNVIIQDEIAALLADKLSQVPDGTLRVSVRYTDGNALVTTAAYRNTFGNGWTLDTGVYAKKTHDRPVEIGVEGSLTWK